MDTDPVPHEAAAGAEPSGVQQHNYHLGRPSFPHSRSLSDGGGASPKLFPSPLIVETNRRTSKDDHDLDSSSGNSAASGAASVATLAALPSTPKRSEVRRGPSTLQMQQQRTSRDTFTPPPHSASNAPSGVYGKPVPLSPKLDHSHIYASPTNILPRRSRGLDFSRAATSLHHSTLAESSAESSPTVGGRGVNIPTKTREYGMMGGADHTLQSSASVWPTTATAGNYNINNNNTQERSMAISSSLGSTHAIGSDSSSSSEDDDPMDEDMDEAYITTPQVSRTRSGPGGAGNPFGSPAMGTLASFQNRQRPRKHPKKKVRGPLGLGFNMTAASVLSRSPPNSSSRARRESISWQANQLHISSGDGEDSGRSLSDVDGPSGDGQPNVTRRAVTRRGNLLVSSDACSRSPFSSLLTR